MDNSAKLIASCKDLISRHDANDMCQAYFARNRPGTTAKCSVIDWSFHSLGNEGPFGFLSQQMRLAIRCQLEEAADEQLLTFFVKTSTTASPAQAGYINEFGAFRKETHVYGSVLPQLQKAGDCEFAPHCYLGRDDFSLLVFEDLETCGFAQSPGIDGLLDLSHLLLTVETLARMHASSMVFEKQHNQSLITSFPHHLTENAYPERNAVTGPTIRHTWVANSTAVLCALLAEIPQYHERSPNLTAAMSQTIGQIFELVAQSVRFRNCFSHGDLWKNNVMFKYAQLSVDSDDLDGPTVLPVEAKFVDFQLARYSPPALDLLTICMMVTSSAFRREHLQQLLNAYYTHLSAVLLQHGLSVAVELPRREFDESCRHFRLAGIVESCLFSHMTLLPHEMANAVVGAGFEEFMGSARVGICVKAFRTSAMYRERMTDMITCLVDEFIEGKN